jgi:carboxyl-terminal processing protease
MRFASAMFDKYKSKLSKIDNFKELEQYLKSISLERQFVDFATKVDNITIAPGEWEESREYMMPQINGLVGRYSKLGEEAFYRFYLPLDDAIKAAVTQGDDSL